jgi:hypothetical protein
VLLQVVEGGVRIHADWLREGPPGDILADMAADAALEAGTAVRLVLPPVGRDTVDTVGLRVAASAAQLRTQSGGAAQRGRDEIRKMLMQQRRELPQFMVAAPARWVSNAMAGGFAFEIDKRGRVSSEPVDGPYRVVMEGVECFVAALRGLDTERGEDQRRYAYGHDGRRYTTIRAVADDGQKEQKTGAFD